MQSILHTNPIKVSNRLSDLGVTKEQLLEVVERMVGARNGCTANHPPGSPGWMAWAEGTCRLREILLPLGWDKNEECHISSVYDGKQIRIAVCNTDDGTGVERSMPQNRSKKGSGTDRIVASNQGLFQGVLEEALNVIQLPRQPGGSIYWYLCVYSEGDVVRAELSCPSQCNNGYFTAFQERIILVGEGDDGVRVRRDVPDDDSGFEINVTRKQAS